MKGEGRGWGLKQTSCRDQTISHLHQHGRFTWLFWSCDLKTVQLFPLDQSDSEIENDCVRTHPGCLQRNCTYRLLTSETFFFSSPLLPTPLRSHTVFFFSQFLTFCQKGGIIKLARHSLPLFPPTCVTSFDEKVGSCGLVPLALIPLASRWLVKLMKSWNLSKSKWTKTEFIAFGGDPGILFYHS